MSAPAAGEPPRRAWAGPRLWGLVLLGIAAAVLVATSTIRSPEGWSASGPRFVPLVVGAALLALSLLFLARTTVRPDTELGERAAREADVTELRTPAALVVALLAYVLLLQPLGYVVATTLFCRRSRASSAAGTSCATPWWAWGSASSSSSPSRSSSASTSRPA